MITTINEWKQINESHDNVINSFINNLGNNNVVSVNSYEINTDTDQIRVEFTLENEYTTKYVDNVLMFTLTFDITEEERIEAEPDVNFAGQTKYSLSLVDYYIGDGGNIEIDDPNDLLFSPVVSDFVLDKYQVEIEQTF